MAVVGLAAGGMVVHPSTAIGTCMPTIRITATTGIGITKQIACRVAASGRHEARRIAAKHGEVAGVVATLGLLAERLSISVQISCDTLIGFGGLCLPFLLHAKLLEP